MTDEKHSTKHNSNDIWDRVNQQSDQIGEIVRVQATTEANLAALANSVETGFATIQASLTRIAERDNRPTNWIGIGSLIVVVVGSLLAFITLQTDPITVQGQHNFSQIENLSQEMNRRGRYMGMADAKLEWYQSWLESIENNAVIDRNIDAEIDRDQERRISVLEGRLAH